jgi:uncharacterized tellurite resistance protein B-like protein
MLRTIAALLDSLGGDDEAVLKEDDLRLAAATLLVHASRIDGTVTEGETERLRRVLAEYYGLPEDDLNRLLITAERQEQGAVDIYRFTSVLRDRLALDQKREIIAMMWRVVFADGRLDALEDNLIWRTAELLAVPSRDRMELKRMVRAELRPEP